MLVTKIQIENNYNEKEQDLMFTSGEYNTPNYIDMVIGNNSYSVLVEDIMDALLPFHAKISRDKDGQ
jgi:hypothetical protein